MKSSELRIGNFVNFAEDGVVFKINEIYIDGLGVENTVEVTYIELDAFEPIPLTEEWLVKFGFEKWNDYCYCNNKLAIEGITSFFNKSICLLRCGNDDYVELINIKYVHQLQNLYFALTNEELTI